MTLTIGRAGLAPTLDGASVWGRTPTTLRLGGSLNGPFVNAKALRDQLLGQIGQVVPVTWTVDPTVDGFYRLDDVQVEAVPTPDIATFRWDATLTRVGNDHESWLTTAELFNDHGLDGHPWHAAPSAADSYHTDATPVSTLNRRGSDGIVPVRLGVDEDAVWAIDPAGWYGAAVELTVSGQVIAGVDAPDAPDDWLLDNELVRVTPAVGGTLDVSSWTEHNGVYSDLYGDTYGSAGVGSWTTKRWRFLSGGAQIGTWDRMAVLRNDPAQVTLRLVHDAGTEREVLDVSLRRGSRTVTGVLQAATARTWKVERDTAEAGEEFTAGVIAAVPDVDDNRYVLATTRLFASDLVQGGLTREGTKGMDFIVGVQPGTAVDETQDLAVHLTRQYIGYSNESTRAIRR